MDVAAMGIFRLLLPNLRKVAKSVILHALRLSDTAAKWDFHTALVMAILRCRIRSEVRESLGEQQRNSLRDPGVKGRLWISRVTLPAPPEDDARQALFAAIEALKVEGI